MTLPAVRPCRPFLRPRRTVGRCPSLLEKARKRRRSALKGKRGRGSGCRSLARRRRLRWELPQRRRRTCRGDCAQSQLPSLLRALLPAPSGEERAADGARARLQAADGLDRRRDDANVAHESLPVKRMSADYIRAMPTINLTDD